MKGRKALISFNSKQILTRQSQQINKLMITIDMQDRKINRQTESGLGCISVIFVLTLSFSFSKTLRHKLISCSLSQNSTKAYRAESGRLASIRCKHSIANITTTFLNIFLNNAYLKNYCSSIYPNLKLLKQLFTKYF